MKLIHDDEPQLKLVNDWARMIAVCLIVLSVFVISSSLMVWFEHSLGVHCEISPHH